MIMLQRFDDMRLFLLQSYYMLSINIPIKLHSFRLLACLVNHLMKCGGDIHVLESSDVS